MRDIFKKIKEETTIEKVLVRLVLAWLVTAVLFFIKTDVVFNSADFTGNVDMAMYICFITLFFVFFCALGYFNVFKWVETYGPMVLLTLYGYLTVSENQEPGYMLGISAVLALSIVYAVNNTQKFAEITKKSTLIIIYAAAAVLYAGYVGSVMVIRYLTYRAPAFDFGIWSQMFHYMRTTLQPLTTVERGSLLSHFAVHFSPIYYLYFPFYFIFPSPVTLEVLQIVTLVSGIVPVYKLCKHFGLSKSATAAIGVMFALYPALACGTYYDLHENCFLVPLMLWLFYFIEKDNTRGIIIFAVLTALVKEDAPMYLACIGLYMVLGKKKYIKGTVLMLLSVAYFLIVSSLMGRFGLGIMSSRFNNYRVSGTSGSLMDVIRNFAANPAYVLSECFSTDRLTFMLQMFLPVGFLSFASRKISDFILIIPVLLINFASDYQYQHSIFFQYVFGTTAILFYMAIKNYAQLTEKSRRFMCSAAICAAVVFLPVTTFTKSYYFDNYTYEKENNELLDAAMESIPKDASVEASTFFVAHLSDREELYEYPYTTAYTNKPAVVSDYYVLDLRFGEISEDEISAICKKGYKIREKVDALYIILEKK